MTTLQELNEINAQAAVHQRNAREADAMAAQAADFRKAMTAQDPLVVATLRDADGSTIYRGKEVIRDFQKFAVPVASAALRALEFRYLARARGERAMEEALLAQIQEALP